MRMAGVWVLNNLCAAAVFSNVPRGGKENANEMTQNSARTNLVLGACFSVGKTNENPRSGIALHCGTAGCVVLVTKMPHEGWQGTEVTRVCKKTLVAFCELHDDVFWLPG